MNNRKPTILIVEKDRHTLALYQRALGQSCEILAFRNEAGVLNALSGQTVAAIILEPNLPFNNGWDLLHSIRAKPELEGIPVILCSTIDERKHGLAMGADIYLVKPVSPDVLVDVLNSTAYLRRSAISGISQKTKKKGGDNIIEQGNK